MGSEIRSFDLGILTGVLQTRRYSDRVIRAMAPDAKPDDIVSRVEVRQQRSELLDQGLVLWSVIDEAVIRRAVGGPSVQQEQLRYLIERAKLPNVTLQVLPFAAGEHIGMDASFSILAYDDHPSLGYVEQFGKGLWLEKESEVHRVQFHWEHLVGTALKPGSSLEMIAAIAEEMSSD